MADEEDRQPPQAYDTVTPAGVGATTSNLMSPRDLPRFVFDGRPTFDVAMEEMPPDPLYDQIHPP